MDLTTTAEEKKVRIDSGSDLKAARADEIRRNPSKFRWTFYCNQMKISKTSNPQTKSLVNRPNVNSVNWMQWRLRADKFCVAGKSQNTQNEGNSNEIHLWNFIEVDTFGMLKPRVLSESFEVKQWLTSLCNTFESDASQLKGNFVETQSVKFRRKEIKICCRQTIVVVVVVVARAESKLLSALIRHLHDEHKSSQKHSFVDLLIKTLRCINTSPKPVAQSIHALVTKLVLVVKVPTTTTAKS